MGRNQVIRVLASQTDGVVGYALGWQATDMAELTEIAMRTDWKGRGAGRQLLNDFVQQARLLGAGTIDLDVKDSNHIAIALYESIGFAKVGLRTKYYRDGADAYLYSLELS